MSPATSHAADTPGPAVLEGPEALPEDRFAAVATLDGTDTTARLPRSLSPSRASDFIKCPRSFYYKVVAGLSDPPTLATASGTAAHWALEHLFDLPPAQRTPQAAADLVGPAWKSMTSVDLDDPRHDVSTERGRRSRERAASNAQAYARSFPPGSQAEAQLLDKARAAARGLFTIEDPSRFDPAGRELGIGVTIRDVPLFGIIDRLDEWGPDGARLIGISDYKTGKPPRPGYERDAFFGMLTYAALVRAEQGRLPDRLRLLYTSHGQVLVMTPDASVVDAHERRLATVWRQITTAARSGVWPTRRSRLCDWCPFQADLCPEFNPHMAGVPLSDEPAARV